MNTKIITEDKWNLIHLITWFPEMEEDKKMNWIKKILAGEIDVDTISLLTQKLQKYLATQTVNSLEKVNNDLK